MQRHVVFAVLSFAACAATASAQPAEPPPALGSRKVTVLAGIGVATAGLGLQTEVYFHRETFSAFGGFGYWPEGNATDMVYASGGGVAAGLRAYTPGRIHRGFLEVAVSPIVLGHPIEDFPLDPPPLHYGPSMQAGWQMARPGGFTLAISLGVGHVSGDDVAGGGDTGLVVFIGLGRTWRKR